MLTVQRYLDDHRNSIEDLDYVDVRGVALVEGEYVRIPLSLRTKRALSFAERLRLADDAITYVRENIGSFRGVLDIPDDGASSIATTGPE